MYHITPLFTIPVKRFRIQISLKRILSHVTYQKDYYLKLHTPIREFCITSKRQPKINSYLSFKLIKLIFPPSMFSLRHRLLLCATVWFSVLFEWQRQSRDWVLFMKKVHGISRRIKEAGVDPADRRNMSKKSWNILFVKKKNSTKNLKKTTTTTKKSWRTTLWMLM